MRQILVDYARARNAEKRGGNAKPVTVDVNLVFSADRSADFLALNEALAALERFDERKARVVELRYFGGLTGDEIASSLGMSTATVARELRMAEAWLSHRLSASQ